MLVLALVWGCGGAQHPAQEPQGAANAQPEGQGAALVPASPSGAESPSEGAGFNRSMHMRLMNFGSLLVLDALVAGDLERAQRAAIQLESDIVPESFPSARRPLANDLVGTLGQLGASADLYSASQALGQAVKTCGSCHRQLGRGPVDQPLRAEFPEGTDETLGLRMVRHGIAVEQFWLGLMVPADASWQDGVQTLAAAPLAAPTLGPGEEPVTGELQAAVERLQAMAGQARASQDADRRARFFGAYLAECASCHAQFSSEQEL